MPHDKSRYPKNWKAIALQVKENAGWCCEECGRPCRKPKVSWLDFVQWLFNQDSPWVDQISEEVHNEETGEWGSVDHPQRFTLTVAHLDHDPENPDARLAALCAPCHLRYDAPMKAAKRKNKQAKKVGQLSLLEP